jgi:hypothetical protein
MSQLLQQKKPIVTNTLVITAFSIHVILNIADFGFYAWANDLLAYRDNFNRFIIGVFKPLIAAALIAPFICLMRNSTIKGEFRNMLFFAVSISIVFSIMNFAGTSDIRY